MTEILDPARTALLLMDYQNGILERYTATDGTLLERAAAAIDTVRGAGATVAYVRVALDPEESAAVPRTNKRFSSLAASGTIRANDAATEIHDTIKPRADDIVVRKTRVGAFTTTDLDRQLRSRGIDALLLGGIATSGVVLSTVRDGADRDYQLVVLADLCADQDSVVHRVLIEKVFPRQADVTASDQLVRLFGARR